MSAENEKEKKRYICTDLKAAGIPVDVAKDIMGHSSITITADIYSHAESNSLNEAKAKMDKLNRQETRKSLLPVKLCAI